MGARALPRLTSLGAAAALLAGCGDDEKPTQTTRERATPPRPPLCGPLRAERIGRITGGQVAELSGLARTATGRLLGVEDSGNSATLIVLRRDGSVARRLPVPGAQNVDWEDVAARRGQIYVADIGDNATTRRSITVYRFGGPTPQAITLRYPDVPHDAEALIADPLRDELLVITKGILDARVYRAPAGATTMRRGPRLGFGLVTAASISADGATLALRSYDTLAVWQRRGREPLTRTLTRDPCISPTSLGGEGQGEALALDTHGRTAYTAPEGPNPVLRRYTSR